MKTIILGREGDQPFKIKGFMNGVSRRHAQLTINRDDWYLEDLGSSNGTYVRDEDTGEMKPVRGKYKITPMSFIFLGPENSRGCCFYAKQAVLYGDLTDEHIYMRDKDLEFDEKAKQLEKNIKMMRIAGPIIVLFAVFVFTGLPLINNLLGEHATEIRIVVSSLSSVLTALYDGTARKKKLQEERDRWHYCPNPECSHVMTSKDIRNMYCSKCKK